MENNDKLKEIATKVLSQTTIPKTDNYGFAVVTILMIISIILTCIRILQECNKNKLSTISSVDDKYNLYGKDIKEYSLRRGWFTKMRIKKVLRKQMDPDDFHKYGLSVLNALLDTGTNLTQEEIKILVEAANV